MTPADAAELLTIAAAFDRRTIGEADAIAWADALHGLNKSDCAQAVREHFQTSTEYLMPAHVRRGVRRIREARLRAVTSAELEPADADPSDPRAYQRAKLRLVHAVADGAAPPAERDMPWHPAAALVEATLEKLPKMPVIDNTDGVA